VPVFIALSASSPFVDGEDTFFQSARLNAVSAFPLSGQCPALRDWAEFIEHFSLLQACGIARSIKDLYWDIRPKPEFGTVEIRVCDTPLTVERAAALAALAQALVRHLLRTRPVLDTPRHLHVARYNKFQACRYGYEAQLSDPIGRRQVPLRQVASELLAALAEDARELGCSAWLELLDASLASEISDAKWLRRRQAIHGNLNDVVRETAMRFGKSGSMNSRRGSRMKYWLTVLSLMVPLALPLHAAEECVIESVARNTTSLGPWIDQDNWLAPENLRVGLQSAGSFMPLLRIKPTTAAQILHPASRPLDLDKIKARDPLDQQQRDVGFLLATRLYADGVVVLSDGRISGERYWNGLAARDQRLLLGGTRPLLSLMGAMAVAQGKLAPDRSIIRHIPALGAQTGLRKLSIRRLLEGERSL
jgi:hypothetical protein